MHANHFINHLTLLKIKIYYPLERNTFAGTHTRLGAGSVVHRLAGNDMVLSLIRSYLAVTSKQISGKKVLDKRGGVNAV